jgi:menaquinone-specific isochorismate synthase
MRVTTMSPDIDLDPFDFVPRDGYLWRHRGEGFAAWGEAARIEVGTGPDRFRRAAFGLATFFSELSGDVADALAFGSFTFDPEEAGSVLVVPSTVLRRRAGETTVTRLGEPSLELVRRPPSDVDLRIRYAGSTISEVQWLEAVARASKSVANGELEKVVLARDVHVWSEEPIDVRLLARRLEARFPECFTFLCDGLVGASPELLVRRRDREVTSLVLAGSAPRAEGERDAALGAALLASTKDRAEHAPAVRSVSQVLGRLCKRLEVSEEPHLLRLANVQHLATDVTGELRDPIGALEIAGALHPTAAVCGAPKADAQQMIRELEGMSRGRYAGPVGWVDVAGNGEWAIALRCAQFEGARGRLFAGNGIVGASEPEAELEETRLKLRAMTSALET